MNRRMSAKGYTTERFSNALAGIPGRPAAASARTATVGTLASCACVSIARPASSSAGVWPIRLVVTTSCRLTSTSADAS